MYSSLKIINILIMKILEFIRPEHCDLGENWADYCLDISNIKKGEVFYECTNYGKNIKLKALDDVKKTNKGWTCYAETSNGKKVELFMSANTQYSGVMFFKTPQYLEYDDKNGYVYPIV